MTTMTLYPLTERYGLEMSNMSCYVCNIFMQFSSTFKCFNETIEEQYIIGISHNPQEVSFSVVVTVLLLK